MTKESEQQPVPAPGPEKDAEPANPNAPRDPAQEEEGQQQAAGEAIEQR